MKQPPQGPGFGSHVRLPAQRGVCFFSLCSRPCLCSLFLPQIKKIFFKMPSSFTRVVTNDRTSFLF